jgi:ATP phosphoribosyltransferase regulatory subunit HisZ
VIDPFTARRRGFVLIATKLRYPTGVRPLLIEETARRRRAESRIVAILERAAFDEVLLPIIDYAEPYAALTSSTSKRSSYRFVDRDGELVTLRSDFTPMVARALAPSIRDAELPLRVFYRGDVVRCEASRLGANREMFQIGAEIIGDDSIDADVEVLQLAASIVEGLALAPRVVYGNCAPLSSLDDRFTFHNEDDDASYYTGLCFRVYVAGRRTPVAQGGRYDTLYALFGADVPAVGFTFTLDDLCE